MRKRFVAVMAGILVLPALGLHAEEDVFAGIRVEYAPAQSAVVSGPAGPVTEKRRADGTVVIDLNGRGMVAMRAERRPDGMHILCDGAESRIDFRKRRAQEVQ